MLFRQFQVFLALFFSFFLIGKSTLADPTPLIGIFQYFFFFETFPKGKLKNTHNKLELVAEGWGWGWRRQRGFQGPNL